MRQYCLWDRKWRIPLEVVLLGVLIKTILTVNSQFACCTSAMSSCEPFNSPWKQQPVNIRSSVPLAAHAARLARRLSMWRPRVFANSGENKSTPTYRQWGRSCGRAPIVIVLSVCSIALCLVTRRAQIKDAWSPFLVSAAWFYLSGSAGYL